MRAIEQINSDVAGCEHFIAAIEKREGGPNNALRSNPRYKALYRFHDRALAERRSLRTGRGPTIESETRSMANTGLDSNRNKMNRLIGDMREIMNSTGGKLGDQFRNYCSLEDELENVAGDDRPDLTGIGSRDRRLEAWEAHMFDRRGVTPGAGLQDPNWREQRGNGGEGGPFRSLGEQLQAVVRAGLPGGRPDPRLWDVRAATGMSEGVGADGGFLVQHDFSREIWQRVYEVGRVLSRVNKIPITSNANSIKHPYLRESSRANGSRYGGLRVYRKAEAATVSNTKPSLGEFSLQLETGMALCYLTDELVADAPQLDAFLRQTVPQEIAFSVEDEIFNGNGVGKCKGILNADALVTVAKESGQIAGTIVNENITKMFARLPASSVPNAAWFINQACWPQIFQLSHVVKNVAGTENVGGSAMFIPTGGIAGKPFGTLVGLPIIPVEYCANVGTVGDIMLVDFSQYALIEKGGVDVASSIHVQFIYGEQVLRFTFRNNGSPGYAWNDGALTPFKGSNTISPFITLATRS